MTSPSSIGCPLFAKLTTVTELTPRARRLRLAFDLFEAGVAMHRQTLRRRYPDADDAEIDRRLDAWLIERPGAEHGDVAGPIRVRPLPCSD